MTSGYRQRNRECAVSLTSSGTSLSPGHSCGATTILPTTTVPTASCSRELSGRNTAGTMFYMYIAEFSQGIKS